MNNISVVELLKTKDFQLELALVSGRKGLKRKIYVPDINRPGFALAGFYDYFDRKRIQIIGRTELAYIRKQTPAAARHKIHSLFSLKPCCVMVTKSSKIPDYFAEYSEKFNVPLLITSLPSAQFIIRVIAFLEEHLAPQTFVHGVLMDVYGMGVLILGKSGVGKSECALELVERGHRLVADDVVDIRKVAGDRLIGSGSDLIKNHLEIRGLGIINIKNLFGAGAVINKKDIDMVVSLEDWAPAKEYDRLGLEDIKYRILDVDIPHILVPVRPGRNITIIVEIAAMNERLKRMGYHSAKEFNKQLMNWIKDKGKGKIFG